jgi:hypothetical protein
VVSKDKITTSNKRTRICGTVVACFNYPRIRLDFKVLRKISVSIVDNSTEIRTQYLVTWK